MIEARSKSIPLAKKHIYIHFPKESSLFLSDSRFSHTFLQVIAVAMMPGCEDRRGRITKYWHSTLPNAAALGYAVHMKRMSIRVSGRVQGVGFRPFVYRLAIELNLCGQVCNDSSGVLIEVQGGAATLDAFVRRLRQEAPRLARITDISTCPLPLLSPAPQTPESRFVIVASPTSDNGHSVLISPDTAICDDCLAELFDPADRRHLYPFINCTNCGPRYTITRSIPYDRATTSMACFPLCPNCAKEYADPADRRFHAEPVACAVCGPQVWLTEAQGVTLAKGPQAVIQTAVSLAAGHIAAVRGLGGFHLACNARDEQAIALLRRRKHRPHKALAVMVANLSVARSLAYINEHEAALMQSEARPIVLVQRKAGVLPDAIAPDVDTVGLMLAYTPLHHVLLHEFSQVTSSASGSEAAQNALVMTSGNPAGEPLCLGNREALQRLSAYADCFLLHNRDILIRADDSVARVLNGRTQFLRRGRGYTPGGLPLPGGGPEMLREDAMAFGADMKSTLCLRRGDDAFVSQHLGDMESPGAQAFAESTADHLAALLETTPRVVLADLHPGYHSSRLAREYAEKHGLPLHSIQHHEAHLYAVLGENANNGPALGLLLDGTGFGPDKTIWGGELLLATPGLAVRRMGRLSPFPLPGGERAIVEPWRIAAGLCVLHDLPLPDAFINFAVWPNIAESVRADVYPLTSSCGRLFDAVAAALELLEPEGVISYEGQAAIRLESAQTAEPVAFEPAPVAIHYDDAGQALLELCSATLFREALLSPDPVPVRARRFHLALIHGLARMATLAAETTGVRTVALGGGVLQNRTVALELPRALENLGLTPLIPKELPPGDGAISYGQLIRYASLRQPIRHTVNLA